MEFEMLSRGFLMFAPKVLLRVQRIACNKKLQALPMTQVLKCRSNTIRSDLTGNQLESFFQSRRICWKPLVLSKLYLEDPSTWQNLAGKSTIRNFTSSKAIKYKQFKVPNSVPATTTTKKPEASIKEKEAKQTKNFVDEIPWWYWDLFGAALCVFCFAGSIIINWKRRKEWDDKKHKNNTCSCTRKRLKGQSEAAIITEKK